eukprot:scaffold63323_cov10-Tisochrysis_lutea.AAC.1
MQGTCNPVLGPGRTETHSLGTASMQEDGALRKEQIKTLDVGLREGSYISPKNWHGIRWIFKTESE